jgi:hypothetical protein
MSSALSPSSDVTGKGKHETALLKANITDQLNRLLTQLEDLEELKDGKSTNQFIVMSLFSF